MPENILKTRIQHKIDTSANWTSSNLILKNGELGIERTIDNKIKIKIGDGINTWTNLPYATSESNDASGQSVDEIYIGTTEPTGYKLWINPEEGEDEITSSFIIPVTFSEDAQTENSIVSSEITFAEINAQYLKNANLKLRGTLNDVTIDFPFIGKVAISENDSLFIFGLFSGDSFISIMVSNNNIWEREDSEISGKTYIGENGIKVNNENNTIRSTYGDPITTTTNFATIAMDDPNAIIMINDGSDPNMEEDTDIPVGIGYIQIPITNHLPINQTTTINFKNNNTIAKTVTDTVKIINLGTDSYYSGNQDIIKAFVLSDKTALAAIESVINDTWVLFTMGMDEELVAILIFSAKYVTDYQIDEIEIQISETRGKTIPSNAIRGGNGIKIEENATISLNYSSTNNKQFGEFWKINQLPAANNYLINQIYGWYVTNQSGSMSWESGQTPALFGYWPQLIMNYYNDGYQNTSQFNHYNNRYKQYRKTINYEEDSYFAIPIYIEESQKLRSGQIESDSLVICKEMGYKDNLFYNHFSSFLNQVTPHNIFYAGTYNCQETAKDVGANGIITPIDPKKPGIVFLFLDTGDNNWYFFIFSNANDLGFDVDNGFCVTQGIVFTNQKGIPLQALTSGYNNNDANSIVLGHYNQANSNPDYGQIILGEGNTAGSEDVQLILGHNNNSASGCYFQVGNGDGINLFEVGYANNNYGVHINGNIYKNNQEAVLPTKIKELYRSTLTLSSDSQLSDVINAYEDLQTKYNTLLSNLHSCGLVNNIY